MPQIYAKPLIVPPYPKSRDGHCGMCGERLGDMAYLSQVRTAWYMHMDLGRTRKGWHTSFTRALICEECFGPRDDLDCVPFECSGCGITVKRWVWALGHKRIGQEAAYCSAACGAKARRKAKRIKTMQCVVCKQQFESARRDAQYCSHACRQQRYRTAKAQP